VREVELMPLKINVLSIGVYMWVTTLITSWDAIPPVPVKEPDSSDT